MRPVWALLLLACGPRPFDTGVFPALAADALVAADRCAMDQRTTLEGLTVDGLLEACSAFVPMYDERARAWIGRSSEGDALIAVVARMADDVRHLHRTLVLPDHPGEAQIMVDHIRVSSAALRARVAEQPTWTLREPGCAALADLELLRQNGASRVENLRTTLRQYGTVHKAHPELVRNRMLEVYGLSAVAWLAHERGRWSPGCPGHAEAAPMLDALGGVVEAFEAARAPLRAAQVRTDEEAERLEASLAAAIAGWEGL